MKPNTHVYIYIISNLLLISCGLDVTENKTTKTIEYKNGFLALDNGVVLLADKPTIPGQPPKGGPTNPGPGNPHGSGGKCDGASCSGSASIHEDVTGSVTVVAQYLGNGVTASADTTISCDTTGSIPEWSTSGSCSSADQFITPNCSLSCTGSATLRGTASAGAMFCSFIGGGGVLVTVGGSVGQTNSNNWNGPLDHQIKIPAGTSLCKANDLAKTACNNQLKSMKQAWLGEFTDLVGEYLSNLKEGDKCSSVEVENGTYCKGDWHGRNTCASCCENEFPRYIECKKDHPKDWNRVCNEFRMQCLYNSCNYPIPSSTPRPSVSPSPGDGKVDRLDVELEDSGFFLDFLVQ